MNQIKDIVVLVTGGGAGIGAEIVKNFLEEGAKHVAILDINADSGKNFETELASKYGSDKVKFYKCDVTTSDLDAAFEDVVKQLGYIDVVVNAAGILDDSKHVKCIEINLTALVTSSFKAYDLMRKDHGGRGGTIINISSVGALVDTPMIPVYSATKSAVLKFSNCLGMKPTFSRTGVRVIAMCFGLTNTALVATNGPETFDPEMEDMMQSIGQAPKQTPASAARGVIEAYKRGHSASTWLVQADNPPLDITNDIKEGLKITGRSYKQLQLFE